MANMTVNVYGDLSATAGKTVTVDLDKRFDRINLQGMNSPVLLGFEFIDRHVDQGIELVALTLNAEQTGQRSR